MIRGKAIREEPKVTIEFIHTCNYSSRVLCYWWYPFYIYPHWLADIRKGKDQKGITVMKLYQLLNNVPGSQGKIQRVFLGVIQRKT